MSFSDSIRHIRHHLLLNQQSFADSLHVSLASVHRWEAGKSIPNLSAMRSLRDFCESRGLAFETLEKEWLAEKGLEKGADT